MPAKIPFAVSADPNVFDHGSNDKDHCFRTSYYEAEQQQREKLDQTLGFFKHHMSQ